MFVDVKTPKTWYKMIFIENAGGPELGSNTPEDSKTSRKIAPLDGLEAVREGDEGVLCVRAVGGATAEKKMIARIIRVRQPAIKGKGATAREEIYSLVLNGGTRENKEEGGDESEEVMAVRVSTHPTRLAAPRDFHAVLMLPDDGGSNGLIEGKER